MEYKIVKFKNNNKEIDIKIDENNKTSWFTSADLQTLFNKEKGTISKYINTVKNNVNQKGPIVSKMETFRFVDDKKVTRNITHYSLEIVIKIAQKLDPELGIELPKFIENYLKDNEPLKLTDDDVIILNNGNLKVTLSIASKEQILYMSQDGIAILFGMTQQNFSLHIKSIIEEGELDEVSVRKFYLHTENFINQNNVNQRLN